MYENLTKTPIKVGRANHAGRHSELGVYSRINYNKIYTVEHYALVVTIGMVADNYLVVLQTDCHLKTEQQRRPRVPSSRNNPEYAKESPYRY